MRHAGAGGLLRQLVRAVPRPGRLLAQLAADMPQVRVVKVNVDECPVTAARYKVTSLPNVMVFKAGRVTAHHVGLTSEAQQALLDE